MPDQTSTITITLTNTKTEQSYSQRNIVLLVLGLTVLCFLCLVGFMYREISRLRKRASYEQTALEEPLIVGVENKDNKE
jgi:uncharacterized membrane protein